MNGAGLRAQGKGQRVKKIHNKISEAAYKNRRLFCLRLIKCEIDEVIIKQVPLPGGVSFASRSFSVGLGWVINFRSLCRFEIKNITYISIK